MPVTPTAWLVSAAGMLSPVFAGWDGLTFSGVG
jgi:hypothetical protein